MAAVPPEPRHDKPSDFRVFRVFRGSSVPRTGKAFWRAKLAANIARDRLVNRQLRRQGWRVVRVGEHSLRKTDAVARRIRGSLTQAESDETPRLCVATREGAK